MKKQFTILVSIVLASFNGSILAQNCVQCTGGSANGNTASIIGINSSADGTASFAGGLDSRALGKQSFAFGDSAFAMSPYSIALGKEVMAFGGASVALGQYVNTTISSSMVFGYGFNMNNKLQNSTLNSIMFGCNSDKSTLFIGPSSGLGLTGKIGIGDVTDPQAKLHIKADDGYTTEVLVQWSNNNMANLWLGSTSYGLKASTNKLEFKIPTGGKYVFNDGNLGIGTAIPTEKLEVVGNVKITSGFATTYKVQAIDSKGLNLTGTGGTGITIANNGKVGIGTTTALTEQLEVNGNIKQASGFKFITPEIRALDANGLKLYNSSGNGIVINVSGNVGIGTPATSNRLEVAGTVNATSFLGNGSGLNNVMDYRWKNTYTGQITTNGKVIIGYDNYTGTDLTEITDPQLDVRSMVEDNHKIANFVDGDGRRIFFVPKINGGYNPIASINDAGIFWSDGIAQGSNQNEYSGFVIAPHRDGAVKGIKIDKDGNVGIGKAVPTAKLDVNGDINANTIFATSMEVDEITMNNLTVVTKIEACEIEVKVIPAWKDCVFEADYNLLSLKETEEFIKQNKHLPGIPSEKEVMENGINVGEMNALLLQKIEELTLYVIELEKEIKKLK